MNAFILEIAAIGVTVESGNLNEVVIRKPDMTEVTSSIFDSMSAGYLSTFHRACFSFQPDMAVVLVSLLQTDQISYIQIQSL